LIGKYIAEHSEAKVIFNGDGADELMGGYLYMRVCPDAIEHDCETRRLLKEIHAYDVLRSNKSVSINGLEPRTPFLDREFTQTYLNIPAKIRFGSTSVEEGHPFVKDTYIEKRLIRDAFQYVLDNPATQRTDGKPFLPDEILWRKKEAFSDGVSNQSRSLYEIIQDHTNQMNLQSFKQRHSEPSSFERRVNRTNSSSRYSEANISHPEYLAKHIWRHASNVPRTNEQVYYRSIFEKHFPYAQILSHFWMPKYVTATDASARTLSIYKHPHGNKPESKHVSFQD
jgi:asparagine synthase (glutamine-hydrolysing)